MIHNEQYAKGSAAVILFHMNSLTGQGRVPPFIDTLRGVAPD
jgi:hypothetical protein